MNAPDPQKTVETLRPMVHALALHVRDHLLKHGVDARQFYFVDNTPAAAAWSGERRITYRFPGGAEVTAFELRPTPPSPGDITVTREPEGQSKVVDALVRRTKNSSPVDLRRKLKWADSESESESSRDAGMQEVTAGVELGMRTLIGAEAGGEMWGGSVKAEQEFTAKFNAGYMQAWERETQKSRGTEKSTESEWGFGILAYHASKFTSIVEETPMRETTRIRGALEFGIKIHAPGYWNFKWPNRRSLLANLRGIPTEGEGFFIEDQGVRFMQECYQSHPLPDAEKLAIFDDAWAEIEYSRVIKDSKLFDTDFGMEPLNDTAALRSALLRIQAHDPAFLTPAAVDHLEHLTPETKDDDE